jgi:hypothetical protein
MKAQISQLMAAGRKDDRICQVSLLYLTNQQERLVVKLRSVPGDAFL